MSASKPGNGSDCLRAASKAMRLAEEEAAWNEPADRTCLGAAREALGSAEGGASTETAARTCLGAACEALELAEEASVEAAATCTSWRQSGQCAAPVLHMSCDTQRLRQGSWKACMQVKWQTGSRGRMPSKQIAHSVVLQTSCGVVLASVGSGSRSRLFGCRHRLCTPAVSLAISPKGAGRAATTDTDEPVIS